jgi:co-chaperonin GroES (HSP10)
MKLKPLQDKIVVKPDTRVLSTVLIVENKEKDNMGTVVAVGAGKVINGRRQEMPVTVGDYVRFGTMGNDEYLKYFEYFEDGERYLVMSWQDVCFAQEKSNAEMV